MEMVDDISFRIFERCGRACVYCIHLIFRLPLPINRDCHTCTTLNPHRQTFQHHAVLYCFKLLMKLISTCMSTADVRWGELRDPGTEPMSDPELSLSVVFSNSRLTFVQTYIILFQQQFEFGNDTVCIVFIFDCSNVISNRTEWICDVLYCDFVLYPHIPPLPLPSKDEAVQLMFL